MPQATPRTTSDDTSREASYRDGSHGGWDAVWRDSATGPSIAYTETTPISVKQLVQRGYALDLRQLMQERMAGRPPSEWRCLELGCGRATTSAHLARIGCQIDLVDLSEAGLQMARAIFAKHGLREPRCHAVDVRATGLPSDSFDAIYHIGLLEHFDDPKPVIAETHRLLAPGGVAFCVVVPQREKWRIRASQWPIAPWRAPGAVWRRLRGFNPQPASARRDPRTDANAILRTDYSREQYRAWAEQVGAREIQCLPYVPYTPVFPEGHPLERYYHVPIMRLIDWAKTRRDPKLRLRASELFARAYLLTFTK